MLSIAVLGLGAMGSRMAANLIAAGYEVTVWNRSHAVSERFAAFHGATFARSPRDAATGRDVILSMVRDDDAAAEVWLSPSQGALAAMSADSLAIESSTVSPSAIAQLAEQAGERRLRFVEAPVVGSRPQADAGQLLYLVGGQADDVDLARPILDVNASEVVHVGPIGSAATMKLAVNGLFAAQVALYGEITAMLGRTGVDIDQSFDLLEGLAITSPALKRILGLMRNDDFTPNFPVELVAKDLSYLRALAVELDAPAHLIAVAADVYGDAAGTDASGLDISGIVTRYR